MLARSREAAQEFSPRREAWVKVGTTQGLEGEGKGFATDSVTLLLHRSDHERCPRKYVCGVLPSMVRNISMKALTLS